MTLSAVIITHNEEANIGRCLHSLRGVADEVVVVDSGSTDRTEALCREAGTRFESHPWQGYSAQKNYAMGLATGDWILSLDADEALSDELRASLQQWRSSGTPKPEALAFNRLTHYCDRPIRHCGWYPDCKVRLWPAGAAEWEGLVHEELRYVRPLPQRRLEGDLLHFSYRDAADLATRQVRYAQLWASKAAERGKKASAVSLLLKPGWIFIRNYLFKLGVLDGVAGLAVCRMSAHYTFMKYLLLRESNRRATTSK